MEFLPITRREMLDRGWDACDFVYIIGDAYVDHPSFGHAIISRVLESHGYNVGIISQPDWKDPKSIDVFGRPRLGFLVSGGNMDSMVNHYSVIQAPPENRRLHPRRRHGQAPGLRHYRSTATLSARPTRTFPSSSAASRRVCAGWGITITGRTSMQALHFAGQSGRPAPLRHGGAEHRGGGRCA